jgi:hypothetical protein
MWKKTRYKLLKKLDKRRKVIILEMVRNNRWFGDTYSLNEQLTETYLLEQGLFCI